MPNSRPRARHDEAYKLLFSNAALVEGLLSRTVPGGARVIDRSSLQRVSASFVKTGDLEQRHGDTVWRARLRRPDEHPLFVALEFQSAPQANMAFRIHEYASLVLQEAETQKDLGAGGRPPIVAPFVIYNGAAAWNATTDLADWIAPDPGAALDTLLGLQMRRRYILVDLKSMGPEAATPPPDWFSVLAEWESARWTEDVARLATLWRTVLESGDDGIIRGFAALRRQLAPWMRIPEARLATSQHAGRTKTMIRHEETYLAAQLRKRDEDLRREGRREGHIEGRREGHIEGRRSLLRQLAVQKFGPDVAGELSRLLDGLTDPDRIEALGRTIIECETGAEFIARAGESPG